MWFSNAPMVISAGLTLNPISLAAAAADLPKLNIIQAESRV